MPEALSGALGAREPVTVFFLGFTGLGWRWWIVRARDASHLLGKQFVAVIKDAANPNRTIPICITWGRLRASAPWSRCGGKAPILTE